MRRFKIAILKGVPNSVPGKPPASDWIPVPGYENVWAGVKDMSGSYYYAADNELSRERVTFETSYLSDISLKHRIRFENRDYKILRVYQGEHGRLSLAIDAEHIGEVKAGDGGGEA